MVRQTQFLRSLIQRQIHTTRCVTWQAPVTPKRGTSELERSPFGPIPTCQKIVDTTFSPSDGATQIYSVAPK